MSEFGPLQYVDAGSLRVAYVDVGPRYGRPVLLLHGWPYDIHSYEEVATRLASAGHRVIVPYLRGYGETMFLSAETPRNGQQAVVALDAVNLLDALAIDRAIVAGFDWGARTAVILAAMWPERCLGLVAVSGYIVVSLEANQSPLPPAAELGWWYQYYFATERGRRGYAENTDSFNRLIWKQASPLWRFDDETFERTARSFRNPDHVSIVIHNYRWRLGLAEGEAEYDDLEARIQARPVIGVPTVTVSSDFDGAAADGRAYADRFSGWHVHRVLPGIGHNVPQEAPSAFADTILEVSSVVAP